MEAIRTITKYTEELEKENTKLKETLASMEKENKLLKQDLIQTKIDVYSLELQLEAHHPPFLRWIMSFFQRKRD